MKEEIDKKIIYMWWWGRCFLNVFFLLIFVHECVYFFILTCLVTWFRWHIRSSLTKFDIIHVVNTHCHHQKGNFSDQLDVKGKSFIQRASSFYFNEFTIISFQILNTSTLESSCAVCLYLDFFYGNHNRKITKLTKCRETERIESYGKLSVCVCAHKQNKTAA